MDFGDIIKRSWRITWRYKALWVLGVFAGISGCQPSSGGNSSGGNSFDPSSGSTGAPDFESFMSSLADFLPLIIGVGLLLVVLGVLWSILGIAARGGLITGVNAIEEGSARRLPELWAAGFARFWPLLGFELLLGLPVAFVVAGMIAAMTVPLFGAFIDGREPGFEIIGSMAGALCIGLPLLLVLSFFLGIMRLVGMRYLMLGGQGVFESAGNGWRFLRARFKDTFLMWLINGGLNLVASFAFAIPVVIVVVAVMFPAIAAGVSENWGALIGVVVGAILMMWLLGSIYSAIWGTFTSSLWTVFFRKATGMEVAVAAAAPVSFEPPAPAPEPLYPSTPPEVPDGFPSAPPQPPAGE